MGYEYTIGIVVSLVVIAVALTYFFSLYKKKQAVPLPDSKPGFSWLPKFTVQVEPAAGIVGGDDPVAALERRMSELGFRRTARDDAKIQFARGSLVGDFSVSIMNITLTFSLPIESPTTVLVEYGAFAAFDTGDLWKFATELRNNLAVDVESVQKSEASN